MRFGACALAVPQALPSIEVWTRNIKATCEAPVLSWNASVSIAACTYVYSTSESPTITTVSSTTVSSEDALTIGGTSFFAKPRVQLVPVSAGLGAAATTSTSDSESKTVECFVSTFTSTTIVCTVQEGSSGEYRLVVTVGPAGIAVVSGSIGTISIVPSFTTIMPAQGSALGGTRVTLSGTGLSAQVPVFIGSAPCVVDVSASTSTALVCLTSPPSPTGSLGAFALSYNNTDTALEFTYTLAMTPVVASFSPTVLSTAVSGVITLLLTAVDTSRLPASIHSSVATVTFAGTLPCGVHTVVRTPATANALTISCTLLRGSPSDRTSADSSTASAAVTVSVQPFGLCDTTATPVLDRRFAVHNVSPSTFGTAGGGTLTLSGVGFAGIVFFKRQCNHNADRL